MAAAGTGWFEEEDRDGEVGAGGGLGTSRVRINEWRLPESALRRPANLQAAVALRNEARGEEIRRLRFM